MPGHVLNRPDLPLPRERWDVLVIGGGMLGVACALRLRELEPSLSVLVVEAGGIPSEEGATFVSGSLVPPPAGPRAERGLALLEGLTERTGGGARDAPLRGRGSLVLGPAEALPEGARGAPEARLAPAEARALEALLDASGWRVVRAGGGWGSAEAAALRCGRAAVRAGADLALNARAVPRGPAPASHGGGWAFGLERLAFTRAMTVEVDRVERVTAERVVLAAGAASAGLAEEALGIVPRLPRAYRQAPRLERDPALPLAGGAVDLPVVFAPGVALRPQGEGLLLVPDPPAPDPAGWTPVGGKLLGVPTGTRRELLESWLERADRYRFLERPGLNLGKTVRGVRGAWDLLGPAGAEALGEGWTLLRGGEDGFALGLVAAEEAAALALGA